MKTETTAILSEQDTVTMTLIVRRRGPATILFCAQELIARSVQIRDICKGFIATPKLAPMSLEIGYSIDHYRNILRGVR